jgi:hypothetical protein
MFRIGLLATLSATILTGCVSTYGYRADDGGDYYYAEPSVDYYDAYGGLYNSIGYGYPGGWYGSFGYGFGFGHTPYSRYGFPYGYDGYRYGYPYAYFPYPHRRPRHHRPPNTLPPGTLPPGVIIDPAHGSDPRLGDRDREGGPWRHLNDARRPRFATPQPAIADGLPRPGVAIGENQPQRRRIMMPQPGLSGGGQPERMRQARRAPVSMPQSSSPPQPRYETPRAAPAPERRIEAQERESRRDTPP